MKKIQLIKSGLIATTAIGAIAYNAFPAAAIPYNGATVYKTSTDGLDQIIISGTASTRVAVMIENQDRSTGRIAGGCGEVRISSATGDYTGLKVDNVDVDASSLPSQTLPSCVNGVFAEARTTNFKTPTGQVIIVNKTPGSAVKVTLQTDSTRYITLNGCGFGILRSSSSSPLPANFKIGTDSYTTSSLPTAPGAPICRTSGGVSTGYTPSSW